MCGCKCCISAKIMHHFLLIWRNRRLKHLKYRSHNAQNRRSGEISSHIFETYKNAVRPHGCHIYNTDVDMDMVIMCPYTYKHHGILNWICVLSCFDKLPSTVLPIRETNKNTTNRSPKIIYHIYPNISHCTVHS